MKVTIIILGLEKQRTTIESTWAGNQEKPGIRGGGSLETPNGIHLNPQQASRVGTHIRAREIV